MAAGTPSPEELDSGGGNGLPTMRQSFGDLKTRSAA